MARIRTDFVAGALDAALAAGATSMSSPALADLAAVASPDVAAISLYTADSNGRITKKEIVHVTAHTAAATTATIVRGREGTSDQAWSSSDKWEHGATKEDFGLNPTIAEVFIDNATQVNKDSTSSSFVDFDALAAITFTVPASGNVVVELQAQVNGDATQQNWGLWDTADIAATDVAVRYSANQIIVTAVYAKRVTGLTPGNTVTYKWRVRRASGTLLCRTSYGGAAGTAIMRVKAA